ncbi:hypothetical protein KO361_03795 [Candidatus Woesearchaeota archaeon]|nr:hypothetical protein [Candidatus Woesearchaeota archaeon]
MVKIHGSVWMILGVLMAVYSKFIQSKIQKSSLSLFFWVGIGFVVFGVFRLIIDYVLSDSSKKSRKDNDVDSVLDRLKKEKDEMSKNHVYSSKEIISCARCGTRHYSNSNFCHMCGYSLK